MPESRKPIRSETVYATPWFELIAKTMRAGEPPYYSLRLPDYVGILAVTPDGRVVAVRQYRPAIEQFTVELPAGLVDAGETPAVTAKRELLEETGYDADEMQVLGEMSTDTGRLGNRIWACYASNVRRVDGYQPEEGMEPLFYSMDELREALRDGSFGHALHLAILALAAAKGLIALS
jgi:ADP-ribose pyrophosphatase